MKTPTKLPPPSQSLQSHYFTYFHRRVGLLLVVCLAGLSLAMAGTGVVTAQTADSGPPVNAQAAIVVDATTGGILYNKFIHRRLPMASTTKIMTALAALSIADTSLTEPYKVVKADLVGEASMGLRENEEVSFQDMLYGMLLNSGNDAATAIARYAGNKLPGTGDQIDRFVSYMNQYAVTLGLRNTHYANPHGLDQADHYTSAFDLSILGWYALKNPTMSKIIATPTATIAGHNLSNLNPILKSYTGANGIKPGFTDNAGLCLAASASRDGQTVISVILGDDNKGYHADPVTLLDYGFRQLKLPQVQQNLQQGATTATAADYIGRPTGNKLIPLGQNSGPGAAGSVSVLNNGSNGSVVQPQINQDNQTSQTDPVNSGNPPGSGPNFLTVLLILLIILGIVYCVLRFTPVGGERGKTIAYAMEDYAARGWHLLRSGLQKLWGFLRPGNHEDEPFQRPPTLPRNTPPISKSQLDFEQGRRVPNVVERTQATRSQPLKQYNPSATPEPSTYERRPTPHPQPEPRQDVPAPTRPASSPNRSQNPLENIFDDVEVFNFEETEPKPDAPAQTPATPQPPRPLSDRPAERSANDRGFIRPPMINPTPVQPPAPLTQRNPVAQPTEPVRNLTPSPARNASISESSEATAARARQAIDYAYAGRITASTEEFRRVVEQNPMFDFGSIEEFEQMPVLGFKALATAYRDASRVKFAILLLDMAIERYPNDLELRNLQRTLRRDAGV